MLDLDEVRKAFADHLSNDPSGRWRMDSALAHVATLCYQRGIDDTKGSRYAAALIADHEASPRNVETRGEEK